MHTFPFILYVIRNKTTYVDVMKLKISNDTQSQHKLFASVLVIKDSWYSEKFKILLFDISCVFFLLNFCSMRLRSVLFFFPSITNSFLIITRWWEVVHINLSFWNIVFMLKRHCMWEFLCFVVVAVEFFV